MTSGRDERLVNQRQIAEIFGVTRETIRKWIDQGMPTRNGPSGVRLYLPSEVIQWREGRATQAALDSVAITDIEEAKRRKLAAEAAMAEIELSKARGEVVEIGLVGAEVGSALATCRARLLGIGASVVPRLQIAADGVEMKAIVDEAVHRALEEISDGALEFASGSGGADQGDDPGLYGVDDDAAAPADVERMG